MRRRHRQGEEIGRALRAARPGPRLPQQLPRRDPRLRSSPRDPPRRRRIAGRRGWAYLIYDSPKLALADFEAAIKLNPADADAYNGRGMAQARLGDRRAAVAERREALRQGGGTSPRVTYNAARIYAIAASVAAAELGEKGRQARQLYRKYQDTAVN